MKRVNFTKLKIKNFLSFGNDPVEVEFKKGMHIITGVNRDKSDRQNGLGKSSLMESLYFSIFGTTLRELKKDLIPNTFTTGICQVDLDFDVINSAKKDSYKIIRTLNPTKLFFYHNGTDVTRDSIKNTEEEIHRVLNASPSIFENCVIMTLNNTIPFMSKSKVDKRKFIEGIFNLDIFSKMLSDVREDYNSTKRAYEIELTKMEDANRTLDSLNKQKQSIVSSRIDKISIYESRKVNNLTEKQKLNDLLISENTLDISAIKTELRKISDASVLLGTKAEQLNQKRYQFQSKIELNEKTLKKFSGKNANCPTCKRPFEDHDKETTDKEISKLREEIEKDQESLTKVKEQLKENNVKTGKLNSLEDKNTAKLNEYNLLEQKKANTKDRIKQLEEWLSTLDEDINALKTDKTEVDPIIDSQLEILEAVKKEVSKNRSYMDMLDTVKFIVSEDGVKSYIVSKVLELFNSKLQYFLNKLDANCVCYFNEYFEEQVLNENKKICSYNSFSSSERRVIDLSVMFSFMEMRRLQGDVTYNINFYDEILDGTFDEKGLHLIKDIINERIEKYDECVYIITHRKENLKDISGDVIYLEKTNGITKRIDYNPFN